MNLHQVQQLVADAESETLEFKKSTGQRMRAAETACGMANAVGGRILIGVSDSGKIVGQQLGPHSLEDLCHEFAEIEPPLYPAIDTVPIDATRAVIVIEVDAGQSAPYVYRGRPYRRSRPTTVELPQSEYQRLLVERSHASSRWETQPAGLGLDGVDADELRRIVAEAVGRGRLGAPASNDVESTTCASRPACFRWRATERLRRSVR